MASKYVQLTQLKEAERLYSDSLFLISKGNWTSDNSLTGDIFTVLSSYKIPYNKLSGNFKYSIEHAVPEYNGNSIVVNNENWNFTSDGGLRIATNGPISVVNSEELLDAAINFRTCQAVSADAWYQFHRKCFDAARAREMSGVVNRSMMEKGRVVANKFDMMAIVYDIGNRYWGASKYYETYNVLTCVNQIDKGKTQTAIKTANGARVHSLYNICPFKRWSVLPYEYDTEKKPYCGTFNTGTENSLIEFMNNCFIYNSEPVSYYLINTLNELSDVKLNIDMSIYDQNKFISLSTQTSPAQTSNVGKGSVTWHYRTLSTAYPPPEEVDPLSTLQQLKAAGKHLNGYGPTYRGNVYLYPVYTPYTFDLWKHNGQIIDYGIYQSEPNPCGSKMREFKLTENLTRLFTFNPQQAIWEHQRYCDKFGGSLPGELHKFFEKFCRIRIYARRNPDPNTDTTLSISYTSPPDPYVLSKRSGDFETCVLTYANLGTQMDTLVSPYITVSGNAPTEFRFATEGNEPEDEKENIRWTIWIESMIIW